MQAHDKSTKPGLTPENLGARFTSGGTSNEGMPDYRGWKTEARRSVADLLDDQEALDAWHRNLSRLRGEPQS
jgi:hypothetical protein